MTEFAIMIEGQIGLNWTRWQRTVPVVEELGFASLHRSDHFTNAQPPDMDSLELWVSLTWLASHTKRIEFGPLVTPFSFRHPALTARMAAGVDDLSGGRLRLGLGAGWQEREHNHYGFDLLDIPGRFARFNEGLQVVTHLLQKDEPLTLHGKYYDFNDAVLLPRPHRPGGPAIVVGGNGEKRTLPLAARFADEWNGDFLTPDQYRHLNHRLDEMLIQQERKPSEVRRTLMTSLVFAADGKTLQKKLRGRTVQEARQRGAIVGTPAEIGEQIEEYEKAGVQRLMLQWLDLDDMDGLELLAKTLLK